MTPTCCKPGWRLTLVGSRFLHDAETRYSPIEGECLAVAYGLHQTRFFTLGCNNLVVATDYKPLLGILNDRSLADVENRRLLNLKEKTLGFRFKIIHVPGRLQLGADAASRFPGAPASLLHLPGEPVPPDSDPPDTVDSNDMTSDLRHRLLQGLGHHPDGEDSALESNLVSACIGALESVPFVSWSDLQTATSSD